MSEEAVRAQLARIAPDLQIVTAATSTATVPLAAAAFGVATGQIAKTLALWLKDEPILLVMGGDARIDNRRFKDAFGTKPKMMAADDTLAQTGHAVGGVCPFGLANPLRVFADESLKAFDPMLPAGGSANTAVPVSPLRLGELVGASWVDVAQHPSEQTASQG